MVEVQQKQSELLKWHQQQEAQCFNRFFVTPCIEKMQEHYRTEAESLHRRQVAAEAYKRRMRVLERDQALARQREQEAAQEQQRIAAGQENLRQRALAEARAAQPVPMPSYSHPPLTPADQEARMAQRIADEATQAQKRAANIAAYERKMREANQHHLRLNKESRKESAGSARPLKTPDDSEAAVLNKIILSLSL